MTRNDLVHTIPAHIAQYQDRPFVFDTQTDRQFTYGEFYRIALHAAHLLAAQNIGRHDRVVFLLPNAVEFAAFYFGCLFIGAVAVPIPPTLHQRDRAFAIQHSGARLVICSLTTRTLAEESLPPTMSASLLCLVLAHEQEDAGGHERQQENIWLFSEAPTRTPPGWQPLDDVESQDLFSIMFTSGTTSTPKGVAHRIGSLLGNAVAFNSVQGFGPTNRFLHVLPMAYMAGFLNALLCPFMAGASVVLARPFDAHSMLRFWQPVLHYGADTFWMVPSMLTALLRVDRDPSIPAYTRAHVKTICVATAPLSYQTQQDFEKKYGVDLFESYGLSELLIVSGNTRHHERKPRSVGHLLPGVDVRGINDQGVITARGNDGELWVQTPYLMAGYLNYDTLQPEPVDPADWFPTGDIGHLDDDGHLFITGRAKDLIIRGGINISPRAIEEIVLQHVAIEDVAVIGVPHSFYGEEVVAFIQLKGGHTLEAVRSSLESLCREHLAVGSAPTRFIEVGEFPRSTAGKIQKARLREQLLAADQDDSQANPQAVQP
jgi:long-chain acyl-CoA synthetase